MDVSGRGPDFLVIGAQRAGTTWLHYVLRQHPGLWLPPVKELHYFDRKLRRGIERKQDWLPTAWIGLTKRDPWVLNYLFGLRSDEWYARLFYRARTRGLIAGEITPAYAILDDEVFHRILRINPKVKLVFVMRDPVERVWSAVNLDLRGGQIEGPLTEERALERAHARGPALRCAYMQTINRLERIFPPEQLLFCFFDDLRDRPVSFISRIVACLGADPNKVSGMRLPPAMNSAAQGKPIPSGFEREMAQVYLPLIRELCSRFEGAPHAWRARHEKLLQSSPLA